MCLHLGLDRYFKGFGEPYVRGGLVMQRRVQGFVGWRLEVVREESWIDQV